MLVAHEMKVISPVPDTGGSHDRVGGLPTHRPPVFPVSEVFGGQHCFLLQIHGLDRVGLASFQCLQIYQSAYMDEGDDPLPVAFLVPLDAPLNDAGEGRACASLAPRSIGWEQREERAYPSSESGVTPALLEFLKSKLGGLAPFMEPPVEGARFLGQIAEEPWGFNFGGLLLTLWLRPDGQVVCVCV